MKRLLVHTDVTSRPIWTTEITDAGYSGRLPADTDITLVVPAGARMAIVKGEGHFWVAENTISLPVAGAFTLTNFEQDKDQIWVEGVAELHFRVRIEIDITVSFWR